LVVTLGWIHWVYGSFGPLFAMESMRSSGPGFSTFVRAQIEYLADLLPVALPIGLVGAAASFRNPRLRGIIGLTGAGVILYALKFQNGAVVHDYWNLAILIPLAAAAAGGYDRVLTGAGPARKDLATGVALAVAGAGLAVSLAQQSTAAQHMEDGRAEARLVDVARDRDTGAGPLVTYVAHSADRSYWVDYETGGRVRVLATSRQLDELAAAEPEAPVLVMLSDESPAAQERLKAGAWAAGGRLVLVPASLVAAVDRDPPS
jgi:hypothetical protein